MKEKIDIIFHLKTVKNCWVIYRFRNVSFCAPDNPDSSLHGERNETKHERSFSLVHATSEWAILKQLKQTNGRAIVPFPSAG